MRCPETNEMAAYLDGAMRLEEQAIWNDHFRRCLKCRKALEELRFLMSMAPLDPGAECVGKAQALHHVAHQASASHAARMHN